MIQSLLTSMKLMVKASNSEGYRVTNISQGRSGGGGGAESRAVPGIALLCPPPVELEQHPAFLLASDGARRVPPARKPPATVERFYWGFITCVFDQHIGCARGRTHPPGPLTARDPKPHPQSHSSHLSNPRSPGKQKLPPR